jgi:hypothetical protein
VTLQLPPERRLDHPERMIDTILAEVGGTEPARVTSLGRARRTRYLLATLAAAAVGVVGVVGVDLVGRGQHDRAADPPSLTAAAPTPSPSVIVPGPAPTADPSRTGARQGRPAIVAVGAPVTFAYLTVSVNGVIAAGREYAVQVTTCVTKLPPGTPRTGLRLSREPWRLETDHGQVSINDPLTDVYPLPTTYPQEGRFHVGDCVRGFIPFGISRGAVVNAIRYDNSLGDHAVWLPGR